MPRPPQTRPPTGEAALFPAAAATLAAPPSPLEGQPASPSFPDARRQGLATAGIVQLRCRHPDDSGQPCIAWRLSRPDGQDWRPCWRCHTSMPPVQATRGGMSAPESGGPASD
jgi:hypothetical protein